MLTPRIEKIASKRLIGKHRTMSWAADQTSALFQSFMPRRKHLANANDSRTFEVLIYPPDYFEDFRPALSFKKWAAVEVNEDIPVPEGYASLIIPAGRYARFLHRGYSHDKSIFQQIYSVWLPASNYLLDDRPHFNVLTERTKLNDPDSEEEIWIPIRKKD